MFNTAAAGSGSPVQQGSQRLLEGAHEYRAAGSRSLLRELTDTFGVMDRSPLVIRSRGLRGYGAAIVGGFTAVWAVTAAIVFKIWARPAALIVWLILVSLCAIAAVGIEVINRLDYVKLADGRLSWRFRQGGSGSQPVSAVREIEPIATGVVISFSDGEPLLIGGVWFRPEDIDKLVRAVESPGSATTQH